MNVRNCSKSDAQQGIHRDCSALDEVSNVHHTTSPGVSRQPIVEDDAFGTAMLLGNLHRSWNGCPWDTSIGSTSKGLFEEVSDAVSRLFVGVKKASYPANGGKMIYLNPHGNTSIICERFSRIMRTLKAFCFLLKSNLVTRESTK